MLLTDLAVNIAERLNKNKSIWNKLPLVVDAEVCIDWVSEVCQDGYKVLVVPELNQYASDETTTREHVKVLNVNKYISILVGYTFSSLPTNDTVASWKEMKYIVDTRELLEMFLIKGDYTDLGLNISEIESQPINEQELDRRNFNAVTSIAFNDVLCNSIQEYSFTSGHSIDSIESPETRASIRRAALSERKLGRRSE